MTPRTSPARQPARPSRKFRKRARGRRGGRTGRHLRRAVGRRLRCCVRAAGCVIPILHGCRAHASTNSGVAAPTAGDALDVRFGVRRYRASRRRARLLASRRALVAVARRGTTGRWVFVRSARTPTASPDAPSGALGASTPGPRLSSVVARTHRRVIVARAAASVLVTAAVDGADEDPSPSPGSQPSTSPSASSAASDTDAFRSNLLRVLGITDGVLGVAQDRVEMVMKQALPVMGGMASQNVRSTSPTPSWSVGSARVRRRRRHLIHAQFSVSGGPSGHLQRCAGHVRETHRRGTTAGGGRAAERGARHLPRARRPHGGVCRYHAPAMVPRLTSDPAVIAAAVPYLRVRLLAVPAVGINFAFRGFWNATQQPQIYMNTLLVMHFVNITVRIAHLRMPRRGHPGDGRRRRRHRYHRLRVGRDGAVRSNGVRARARHGLRRRARLRRLADAPLASRADLDHQRSSPRA